MNWVRNTLFTFVAVGLAGCASAPQQGGTSASTPSSSAAGGETSAPAYTLDARETASCSSAAPLSAQYNATVDRSAFDAALFDKAVLHYTNVKRCNNGLNPLSADLGLRRAASVHSQDMAQQNFFGHTSPVAGRAKLTDRLKGNGVQFRAAAENLAKRSRLQLISGKPYTVIDRASCTFAYSGQTIQPHSYRTMASELVDQWEASPEHRTNLMNPRYTRLGTGGSFQENARNCGDIVATQNFAA
jgi:uncharacterized protein YkwD